MTGSRSTSKRRLTLARAAFAVAVATLLPVTDIGPASASTLPLNATISASNGSGRVVTPGRPCDEGGAGAYWHYEYGADLLANTFSSLPTEALVHLDVHSDLKRFPNLTENPVVPGPTVTGFLQGAESHVSFLNDRGSVKLRLTSGTCDTPTLTFNGSNASGLGSWVVDSATGAYRDIAGNGSFTLNNAEVNPGADNALNLVLTGPLTIPDPQLQIEVVRTYWGSLGTDYASRRVSVVYRITNIGTGDSFRGRITALTNPTSGVSPMRSAPIDLNDLAAGEFQDITVRHQLGLLQPCALVILNCSFQTSFTVNLPDAFDSPHIATKTVTATAPALPPPLF